jgi:integrase
LQGGGADRFDLEYRSATSWLHVATISSASTITGDGAKNAIARACRTAGVPHFHPHDLRHRRLSLWRGQGVPARELAERAGHARASMSLDVYSHVLLDKTEIAPEEFLSLIH